MSYFGPPPCLWCEEPLGEETLGEAADGPLICAWCDLGVDRDGEEWSTERHQELLRSATDKVGQIRRANVRARAWEIPEGWELHVFDNDTYMLRRFDGLVVASYKTRMMVWGWRVVDDEDRFANSRSLRMEDAARYPDPGEWLAQLDHQYPVEE